MLSMNLRGLRAGGGGEYLGEKNQRKKKEKKTSTAVWKNKPGLGNNLNGTTV